MAFKSLLIGLSSNIWSAPPSKALACSCRTKDHVIASETPRCAKALRANRVRICVSVAVGSLRPGKGGKLTELQRQWLRGNAEKGAFCAALWPDKLIVYRRGRSEMIVAFNGYDNVVEHMLSGDWAS